MSEKPVQAVEKKSFSTVLKWSAILAGIAVLEVAGVVAAVKIVELKNAENTNQFNVLENKLQAQGFQISNLEKLPTSITANAGQIAENTGNLKLLTEEFNALKEEVGNKKLELLNLQMSKLDHRMETIEETKSQEALVLSLALMIKENALYHRDFAKEAEILAELSEGQTAIEESIRNIISLKSTLIPSDSQLMAEYKDAIEDFVFATPQEQTEADAQNENRGAVARSIEMIKDTVAGINFDKVVVMKKEKKSDEQQLLLNTLDNLVLANNFNDTIAFIEQNQASLPLELNPKFASWFKKIKQKVMFDSAISNIIAAELSAIRQDINSQSAQQTDSKE